MSEKIPVIDKKIRISQIIGDSERWTRLVEMSNLLSQAQDTVEKTEVLRGLFELLLSSDEVNMFTYEEILASQITSNNLRKVIVRM